MSNNTNIYPSVHIVVDNNHDNRVYLKSLGFTVRVYADEQSHKLLINVSIKMAYETGIYGIYKEYPIDCVPELLLLNYEAKVAYLEHYYD